MQRGLDWYKREPISFLGGVQGLTTKQTAVYSIILDLLYQHGGMLNNDPKWICGWFSDMGPLACKNAISELISLGKLQLENGKITQTRVKREVNTRQTLIKQASNAGQTGGKRSAAARSKVNKNNNLDQADPSSHIEPKRREEKREEEIKKQNVSHSDKKDQNQIDQNDDLKIDPIKESEQQQSIVHTSTIPDNWKISEDLIDFAISEGLTHDEAIRKAEHFKDHYSIKRTKSRDWNIAYKNWIRNHVDRSKQAASNSRARSPVENLLRAATRAGENHDRASATNQEVDKSDQ